MQTIVVCSPSFCKNKQLVNNLNSKLGQTFNIRYTNCKTELLQQELIEELKNAHYAVIGKENINATTIHSAKSLKGIAKWGVGLDKIDLRACNKFNIKVSWKPGVNAESVAEFTLGLMINLLRNITITSEKLHSNIWYKNGGTRLSRKKVGIVGFGNIGKRVAELCRAFKCDVSVCDINPTKLTTAKEKGFKILKLEELLGYVDIITFHIPLNKKNLSLIGHKEFDLIASKTFIINTSRGEIIDEKELIKSLKSRRIAGAALDVYHNEPNINPDLLKLKNLITTPHIAGNSQEAALAMGAAVIDGLHDLIFNSNN